MKQLTYRLLYGLTYAVSLLPFWLLYLIADFFFLLVYFIIRYRRKIVWKNLSTSFPEKSEAELRQISRQFYRWLCDYFVETVKLLSISNERLLRRIEFRGVEQLEECFDRGQECAAILGHYCNWEWLSATGLAFHRHPNAVMGLIYHPLYNDAFDRLFIDIRKAHGGDCIPKKDILRHLLDVAFADAKSSRPLTHHFTVEPLFDYQPRLFLNVIGVLISKTHLRIVDYLRSLARIAALAPKQIRIALNSRVP